MSNQHIIDKMKKLLAMANSKANENEAMIAARQLHFMLSKHNMSIDQLDENENKIDREELNQKCRPWKRTVAVHIAKLYFCEFYINRVGAKTYYVFVGSEANRTFAIHIFNLVIKTIERESRAESRKAYGKEVSSFVNSFWTGASIRINERCIELINQAKSGSLKDEEGNKLPAMLSTYELIQTKIKDWLSDNVNLKTIKTTTKFNNIAALNKGREAGDKVQLSRSLQSKNSTKLING